MKPNIPMPVFCFLFIEAILLILSIMVFIFDRKFLMSWISFSQITVIGISAVICLALFVSSKFME